MYQQSNVPSAGLGVKVGGDGDLAVGVDTASNLGVGVGARDDLQRRISGWRGWHESDRRAACCSGTAHDLASHVGSRAAGRAVCRRCCHSRETYPQIHQMVFP